jgi:hypothetical protein
LQAWGEVDRGAVFRLTLPLEHGRRLRTSPLPLLPVAAAPAAAEPGIHDAAPTAGTALPPPADGTDASDGHSGHGNGGHGDGGHGDGGHGHSSSDHGGAGHRHGGGHGAPGHDHGGSRRRRHRVAEGTYVEDNHDHGLEQLLTAAGLVGATQRDERRILGLDAAYVQARKPSA